MPDNTLVQLVQWVVSLTQENQNLVAKVAQLEEQLASKEE